MQMINRKLYKKTLLHNMRKIQKSKRVLFLELCRVWRIDKLAELIAKLLR